MGIAGQIAESYRALHQPPGSLTASAPTPALLASCISGLSAHWPHSSFTGSHRARPGESKQEPLYHDRSAGQSPSHLSQQPGRSPHPDRLPEARLSPPAPQEHHLGRAGIASMPLLPGTLGQARSLLPLQPAPLMCSQA